MFGKDWQTRWNDTIQYLNHHFTTDRLGDHICRVVPQGLRKDISKELSIGSRSDGDDDPKYQANTSKRHALRGLFLCQRVYYSSLWAKQSKAFDGEEGPDLQATGEYLKMNWKTQSMFFWGAKTEQEILDGIAMFVPVQGATLNDLQAAAFAAPPNGIVLPGNLTLSRRDADAVGNGVTCYVGVQGWLVKSGLVSMRWLMSNAAPNKQVGCDAVFGAGEELWNGEFRPDKGHRAPNVGAGYILHIWSPQNYNWNGHWVISNGDGTICGVNNGEVKDAIRPVLKNYTNHSTLQDQFACYGEELAKGNGKWRTAVMAKIDPLDLEAHVIT